MNESDKPQPRRVRQNLSAGKSTNVTVEVASTSSRGLKFKRNLGSHERPAPSSAPSHKRGKPDLSANKRHPPRRPMDADAGHLARIQTALREKEESVVREKEEKIASEIRQRKEAEERARAPAEPSKTQTPEKTDQKDHDTRKPKRTEQRTKSDFKQDGSGRPRMEDKTRRGKLTIVQTLEGEADIQERRGQSLASLRRKREREKRDSHARLTTFEKVKRVVTIPDTISTSELASRMAVRSNDIISTLKRLGVEIDHGINKEKETYIDAETAEIIVSEYGHESKRVSDSDVEQDLAGTLDDAASMKPRPPVVTIMGHVDHGKTSLLDKIRSTHVQDKEAGGITQHLAAYQATLPKNNARITFIDTPGHAAFSSMRARGADVTDIVVLVVAADDGVLAQTREAIDHARAGKKPIIVAINKTDMPGSDPEKVLTQLLQSEVVTEKMGGDTLAVELSAKTGKGIPELLEAIALQAELMELKANPDARAEGTVLESQISPGKGSLATVIIQRGTLKRGDIFVVGKEWGRVRALTDDRGATRTLAIPGDPVEIMGLQGNPLPGDKLTVCPSESRAKEIYNYRQSKLDDDDKNKPPLAAEEMFKKILEGESKELALVLKTDVNGSCEAITQACAQITNDEVRVLILHSDVGAINESDISLAAASEGLLIGFNVRASTSAKALAQRLGVSIKLYSVIYELIEDLEKMVKGMGAPVMREEILGNAEIRKVFTVGRGGQKYAGCRVTDGLMRRGEHLRLLRDNVVVHESGQLKSLRRFKENVREVTSGYECGIGIEGSPDIRENDVIECYTIIETPAS